MTKTNKDICHKTKTKTKLKIGDKIIGFPIESKTKARFQPQPQQQNGLPCVVFEAHPVFRVGVGAAHFDLELGVEEQDEGDDPVVAVHVQQEGVLDHQPAARPAEAQLVVADAVQALDTMTA